MPLAAFDPPGFLQDLGTDPASPGRIDWDLKVREYFSTARAGDPSRNDGPRSRFFDPTRVEIGDDAKSEVIPWTAFPERVKKDHPVDRERWRIADQDRNRQDEYCEWSVERLDNRQIKRVTFTCESPDYWDVLAATNRDEVVRLYQQYINRAVVREELFPGNGPYRRRNKWNDSTDRGAMHLTQGANNLWAEVNLAAGASTVRTDNGVPITNSAVLIECSGYGNPDRNSDPTIGEKVNGLARMGADITLANPVGLYFHGLFPVGWEVPRDIDPMDFWTYERGTKEHPVRAVFEVPEGLGFTVSEIKIGGEKIDTGGQIADFIKMRLTGIACRFGQSLDMVEGCVPEAMLPVPLEEGDSPPSRADA